MFLARHKYVPGLQCSLGRGPCCHSLHALACWCWCPLSRRYLLTKPRHQHTSKDANKLEPRLLTLCSDNGVCPCACNYAVDASCTCRDLDGTVTITVTKSPVKVLYNLSYIKNVNYLATEETIVTENCEDQASAEIPTCSWLLLDGEIQAHSQVPDFPGHLISTYCLNSHMCVLATSSREAEELVHTALHLSCWHTEIDSVCDTQAH